MDERVAKAAQITPICSVAISPEPDRMERRRLRAQAAAGGGSGGAGFEPDGAEVVASGEAHVGVECGRQAP